MALIYVKRKGLILCKGDADGYGKTRSRSIERFLRTSGAAIWKSVSASGSLLHAPLRCCGIRIAAAYCHCSIALKTKMFLNAGMLTGKALAGKPSARSVHKQK
jgi:hypothetical protein